MAVTDPAAAVRARAREPKATGPDSRRAPSPRRALIAEPEPETPAEEPVPPRAPPGQDAAAAGPAGHRPRPDPGPGPAVPDDPGQPPQGGPAPDRAGLPHGGEATPGSAAQERRRLHHPPAGRHHDPGRAGHERADAVRGPAARHRRGHRLHAAPAEPRLRRGGRAARRRLHQDREGQLRRVGQVRHHPQDDRGDEPGHPGAGDQARRPAAQHADAALPPAGQAVPDRHRDAGDLRPAGPPAGHERDQVGAGGPGLRHPAPQGVRRDRPPGRRGRAEPRRVPVHHHRAGPGRPAGRQGQGRW